MGKKSCFCTLIQDFLYRKKLYKHSMYVKIVDIFLKIKEKNIEYIYEESK